MVGCGRKRRRGSGGWLRVNEMLGGRALDATPSASSNRRQAVEDGALERGTDGTKELATGRTVGGDGSSGADRMRLELDNSRHRWGHDHQLYGGSHDHQHLRLDDDHHQHIQLDDDHQHFDRRCRRVHSRDRAVHRERAANLRQRWSMASDRGPSDGPEELRLLRTRLPWWRLCGRHLPPAGARSKPE